jgi:peptidyl-prolyl cis-trans isomerase B (cyclophilin B)
MKKLLTLFLLIPTLLLAQNRKKKDYLITLTTVYGPMQLVLYDQTPKHKDNFIKLVDKKFYDSLLFHRIIPAFMIQGGDPNSRKAKPGDPLGNGDVGYTVPAEFVSTLFHKKGALAAARDNNPEKASSGCQFYIVQGKVWSDEELQKQIERSRSMANDGSPMRRMFSDEQKQVYKTLGGAPHLDGNYTVFGEVINGLAVVDSIAKQPRDQLNRPETDIRMAMTGQWVKKKKITKQYGYKY